VPEGLVDITIPRNNTTDTIVTNVTRPSLEVFRPTAPSNGAAIIDAPGGGFHVLSYANEGTRVARWLAGRGFTVFVLKYRLYPMPTDPKEILGGMARIMPPPGAAGARPAFGPPNIPIGAQEQAAIADGGQAVKDVRGLAARYGFDPGKVGIIGFSAGGAVSGYQAVAASAADRPNFVGVIYSFVGGPIPSDAPPVFMAAAADDPLSNGLPDLYSRLRQAGVSAELHIYAKGQHGFGMTKQGLPVDGWIDAFYAWTVQQGFAPAPAR